MFRWEEDKKPEGVKWRVLQHKGPLFAPPYEPLPESVHFKYEGKVMKLSPETEEVAGFYSRFIEHEYTTKETFNHNFLKDWRKVRVLLEASDGERVCSAKTPNLFIFRSNFPNKF